MRDLSLLYALRIGILRCTSVDASLIHITIQGSKLEAINPILRTKIVTNKEGPFDEFSDNSEAIVMLILSYKFSQTLCSLKNVSCFKTFALVFEHLTKRLPRNKS